MDAQGWDDRYQDSELVWSATPNLFVAQYLSGRTPGMAVDLGAGEGRNAVWLATQGWDVTAVDFSAAGLAKARSMAFEAQVELATVVSDVDHYHPTTPVDLVLLSYLQVPDEHQRRILRRAAEWLQPGGAVFVVAHDKANVDNGHGGPPDPDVCYTVENTVAALSELRIEVAELAQRPVDGAVALDTVVLAVRD
ncbi:MAG: class I SAM-dependent methyltransferase [Actinobacteria bacterium]|nr:class I SAM-dependent methyltransferase [Micrococcales bacterium]MCB0905065.1 class I SAM-dependent methyltransferase [Actinomycetota bacterium]MCO5298715.1 class I SAM-dependent methyltransferase [Candidatus Nanopelagicales bacterium]MCB9428955.1 class I SAM-dependent methyltransferase [Actinomycetota bacterium]HPE13849.1 class I SAM-dependent methyltransferase [Actinomycetota bacterium]